MKVITGTEFITAAAEDGKTGATGQRGMLPYPAGEYSASVIYTATANVTPVVLLNNVYYVMNKAGNWQGTSTGKTPAQDYATNGTNATWIPFETYKAIYVEMLFARFGLLGSAVFYDEYMFSQYGKDGSGNETDNYSGFANGSFLPDFQINLKKGELRCRNAVLQGSIRRKSQLITEPPTNGIIVKEEYNIYQIKLDVDSVGVLFFSPNEKSIDLEFEVYNVGLGNVCLTPPADAPLFLWRGRTFERVYLRNAGSRLAGIWAPVSSGVSKLYTSMFIIQNPSDFTVDGQYLRSI